MQNILIIQTAFLGDVILATPVVSELQRIYPTAKIDFLLRKGNEAILENHPQINEILILNKKRGKVKEIKRLRKLIRAKKYDLLVNLHRFGSSGMLSFLSGARQKVGFDKNPFSFCYDIKIKHEIGNGTHEVERNLKCIAHLGAQKRVRPQVYPSPADRNNVAELTEKPFVTLAPASVWFTKQLPEERWVALAKNMIRDFTVYLVGGPADFELCERIRIAAGLNENANLAGKLGLLESCALFEKAERCFVNDSGPMHMASAVNAPTTAFFCATVPAFGFGPLSDDSEIRETYEKLVCRPCGLHGGKKCPEGHFKCGNIIVNGELDIEPTLSAGGNTQD